MKVFKNHIDPFVLSSILILIMIGCFISIHSITGTLESSENEENGIALSDDFEILDYWDTEISRVNDTNLNLKFGKNSSLSYQNPYTGKEFEFTRQEVSFDSPNWEGQDQAIIRINGYLLYPEKKADYNPGCLCMHGLNGDAIQGFGLAYEYLERGFVVLCHSFPGHGDSEGPYPEPTNFYFTQEYNESAHYYLTLCSAIQGLRVLENLTAVNNSQIMVTGGSYGALNAMWLSSICGERIKACLIHGFVGDLEKNKDFPSKLIFVVLNKSANQVPQSFWENQMKFFDAKYYLKSDKLPPIFFQIGVTDEYYHHSCINGTFDAIQYQEQKYLQIFPNGHHTQYPDYQNTTKFYIDYIFNGGKAPPKFDSVVSSKKQSLFGTTIKITADISSMAELKSVKLSYKYLDIIGAPWHTIEMVSSEEGDWFCYINPGIITSDSNYFVIAELEGKEHIWFSSKIYTGGLIISNTTIPFFMILISYIAIPVFLATKKRYNREICNSPKEMQPKLTRNLIFELFFVGMINLLFYISIFVPWIVFQSSGTSWSVIYLFNNFFTWTDRVSFIGIALMIFLSICWITNPYSDLKNTTRSSLLKFIFPFAVMLVFFGYLADLETDLTRFNFKVMYPGIGVYIMIFSQIALLLFSIWKRKYQLELGIHEPKNKRWNIDYYLNKKSSEKMSRHH